MIWSQFLISLGSIFAFWLVIRRENQIVLKDITKGQKYINVMERFLEQKNDLS